MSRKLMMQADLAADCATFNPTGPTLPVKPITVTLFSATAVPLELTDELELVLANRDEYVWVSGQFRFTVTGNMANSDYLYFTVTFKREDGSTAWIQPYRLSAIALGTTDPAATGTTTVEIGVEFCENPPMSVGQCKVEYEVEIAVNTNMTAAVPTVTLDQYSFAAMEVANNRGKVCPHIIRD